MPLDPLVKDLLLRVSRANPPSYIEIGAIDARKHYAKASKILDIASTPVHSVDDLNIVLVNRTLRIRHYCPRLPSLADPMPALLFFHGGGFTIGSIDTHDRLCRCLAVQADCQVFSVDYRLAPEHKFPAAVDDAFDSLHWLLAQAPAFAVDPERIAVGGDSAGGTLAAATALHARDRRIYLAMQLLIYPGLSSDQRSDSHHRFGTGYLLDASLIQWFFNNYLRAPSDRQDWRFAPLMRSDLCNVAPAWIALAECDPLVDEGIGYGRHLTHQGVTACVVVYPGVTHAFFQQGGLLPIARRALTEAAAALRRAFNGENLVAL